MESKEWGWMRSKKPVVEADVPEITGARSIIAGTSIIGEPLDRVGSVWWVRGLYVMVS